MNDKPTPEQISKLPKWAQLERKEMDYALSLSRAFCWPTQPKPEPMTREEIKAVTGDKYPYKLALGWFYHTNDCSFRIDQGCSDGINHNSFGTTETRSQGMGRIFKSRADACLAARWEMCNRFAKALAQLDREN